MMQAAIHTGPSRERGADESFATELDRWIASYGLPFGTSSGKVCGWFMVHAEEYPGISVMARDFLAITATSVPSKKVFSEADCIVRERRARLGDKAVRGICELRAFLRFLNPEKCNTAKKNDSQARKGDASLIKHLHNNLLQSAVYFSSWKRTSVCFSDQVSLLADRASFMSRGDRELEQAHGILARALVAADSSIFCKHNATLFGSRLALVS